ncbi:hypothetical protein J6590_104798 [Homalodisca vitripennis]|nr:hypothetical protein J6590_002478 [Homalodisca vitripennis]KAG8323900.1 hypothetical protein J6590_104798 [Homalodisca vitripennis]
MHGPPALPLLAVIAAATVGGWPHSDPFLDCTETIDDTSGKQGVSGRHESSRRRVFVVSGHRDIELWRLFTSSNVILRVASMFKCSVFREGPVYVPWHLPLYLRLLPIYHPGTALLTVLCLSDILGWWRVGFPRTTLSS